MAKGDVVEVQRQIASGVDVKVEEAKGFTLTQFALYAEDHGAEVLHLLLKAGADPLSTLENGHDVPHYAASRENAKPDFLAVLLDAGVSPNMIGGVQGDSLLDAAVSGRNRAIISLLLARGANVSFWRLISSSVKHLLFPNSDARGARRTHIGLASPSQKLVAA